MKKIIMIGLIMATISLPVSVFAAAYVPALGGKLTRGISRVSYYIDYNSGTGFYEYLIINAERNWEKSGWYSPVNMVAASSKAGTMLDIYTEHSSFFGGDSNVLASTMHYNSNGVAIPLNQDYIFARIYINDDSNHNRNATEVQGTIIHEMGHAFGLDHPDTSNSDNKKSIMGQTWFRTVQSVQRVDTDALNRIY